MKALAILRKTLPGRVRHFWRAYQQSQSSFYQGIASLSIHSSGLSADNVPFVKLKDGPIFYGYLPTPIQRTLYRHFLGSAVRAKLEETAVGVAYDIVVRYVGPASRSDELGQGKFYGLSPGANVVEVGAYMGFYAMKVSALVGASGRVVAIEAVPENLALLKRNVEANSLQNVAVVGRAAWSSAGSLTFFRWNRQRASAIADVMPSQNEMVVQADTVDHILEDLGVSQVDFVRVQVNGAEWEVLEGMTQTLNQAPILLVSAIYSRDGRPSWQRIVRLLQAKGYTTRMEGGGNVLAWKAKRV